MLDRSNLYAYQHRLIDFIRSHDRCAAWVDMGLGKTVATLTAFADARDSFDASRMLVVAPLRVARDVWSDEVATWSHLTGLEVSQIHGSRQNRLNGLSKPSHIHTVNRENLAWLVSGYLKQTGPSKWKQIRKWPWDWLCLDESQSFKSQSAQMSGAARRISTMLQPNKIIELTGTPSPNGYGDLWHQMYILDHGRRLGASEKAYKDRWFDRPADVYQKWLLKEHAAAEIQRQLQDIVLSMRAEDYLDLPPVIHNPIYVTLSPAAMRQYQELQRKGLLELAGKQITAVNAGVLGNKLLQCAAGAMYVDGRRFEKLHDTKLDALCEALDELIFSGPVLIGYGFVFDLERLGARLTRYCGKGRSWAVLKSKASLAAFRDGEIDFGVIHPGSAGHGLNDLHLSGSENIIWLGPTNNLEMWDQLNARIAGGHRRMGKNVRIQVILARGTVDEHYMQMLKEKDVDQVALMKALRRDQARP